VSAFEFAHCIFHFSIKVRGAHENIRPSGRHIHETRPSELKRATPFPFSPVETGKRKKMKMGVGSRVALAARRPCTLSPFSA